MYHSQNKKNLLFSSHQHSLFLSLPIRQLFLFISYWTIRNPLFWRFWAANRPIASFSPNDQVFHHAFPMAFALVTRPSKSFSQSTSLFGHMSKCFSSFHSVVNLINSDLAASIWLVNLFNSDSLVFSDSMPYRELSLMETALRLISVERPLQPWIFYQMSLLGSARRTLSLRCFEHINFKFLSALQSPAKPSTGASRGSTPNDSGRVFSAVMGLLGGVIIRVSFSFLNLRSRWYPFDPLPWVQQPRSCLRSCISDSVFRIPLSDF